MPIPTGVQPTGFMDRNGIGIAITPSSDPTCDLELWRKTTETGSSFALYDTLKGSALSRNTYSYFDTLALDNRQYSYKARSVGVGRLPSTFTNTVTARPVFSAAAPMPVLSYSARGTGATLFVSTGSSVQFGTGASPSVATKYLWVPHTMMLPSSEGIAFELTLTSLQNGVTGGPYLYFAGISLPPGATVTGFTALMYRGSTSSTARVSLQRGTTAMAGEGVASDATHTGSSWQIAASTGIGNALVGNQRYTVLLTLGAAGSKGNARFAGAKIAYTIPNYGVGI